MGAGEFVSVRARELIAEAFRRKHEELVYRALGSVTVSCADDAPAASLSWEMLERQFAELKAQLGPRARALWFVDRPAQLAELVMSLDLTPAPLKSFNPLGATGSYWVGTLRGIPLREWISARATAEERARAPWFVVWPGVWLEMDDGQHVLFSDDGMLLRVQDGAERLGRAIEESGSEGA